MSEINVSNSSQMMGANANTEAGEAHPQIHTSSNNISDALVPSRTPASHRTPASQQRGNRKGKGKNRIHIVPTITYNPLHPINMEDNTAKLGVLAKIGHDFCPYAAVAKFPYKYIDKAHLQSVSEVHFAGGQFRARGWTL